MTPDAADRRITGRVTLAPDDAAMLLRAARTRAGFLSQRRLLVYGAGAAWLAAILASDGSHRATAVCIFLSAALCIGALIAGVRAQRAFGARHGRGERDIALDDDGVTIAEPGMRVQYAWSRFDRAYEGRDHFVLHSAAHTVSLPKRAFAVDEITQVRAMIAARLTIEPIA